MKKRHQPKHPPSPIRKLLTPPEEWLHRYLSELAKQAPTPGDLEELAGLAETIRSVNERLVTIEEIARRVEVRVDSMTLTLSALINQITPKPKPVRKRARR